MTIESNGDDKDCPRCGGDHEMLSDAVISDKGTMLISAEYFQRLVCDHHMLRRSLAGIFGDGTDEEYLEMIKTLAESGRAMNDKVRAIRAVRTLIETRPVEKKGAK